MTDSIRTRLYLLLSLLVVAACDGGSDPLTGPPPDGSEKSPTSLFIIQLSPSTPLFNTTVSFYAKTDDDAEGIIYFQNAAGGRGEKFARIRVKKGSLLARPGGGAFAAKDSILITMTMTSARDCQVEMQPSGLTFTTNDPAELALEYYGVVDLNGDGKIDASDDFVKQKLAIWRQEKIGDPYVKIGTIKTEGTSELKATLTSFTRFAIAY